MDKRNGSGYMDQTAYLAEKSIRNEAVKELEREQRAVAKKEELVKILKRIIEIMGFELIGRIGLRDVKSGKEYR